MTASLHFKHGSAMPTTKKATKKKGVPAAGIAAGAAAAAAAAGAAYYFYGTKHAKQHRAKAARWANAMKKEVVREAKKLKDLDDTLVHGVIDRVSKAYRSEKGVTPADLKAAVAELKSNWKKVKAEAVPAARKAVKKATKKKTTKKSSR